MNARARASHHERLARQQEHRRQAEQRMRDCPLERFARTRSSFGCKANYGCCCAEVR